MKYTMETLREALRNLNPTQYDNFQRGKFDISTLLRLMFEGNFARAMNGELVLSDEDREILTRAHNDIAGSGHGWLEFDED
jgi:hypothetical protein